MWKKCQIQEQVLLFTAPNVSLITLTPKFILKYSGLIEAIIFKKGDAINKEIILCKSIVESHFHKLCEEFRKINK